MGFSRASIDRLPAPFLGVSPFVREIQGLIPRLAESAVPILIEGESGTGKTHLARALHWLSPRVGRPFQVVDCGAIPATLFASELFGHRRGAFTGADRDRAGRLEAADGGTVLLSGIQHLDLESQAALLRVYEGGEVLALGAAHPRRFDLRLLQTCQVPLSDLVAKSEFRADLYYRLNGATVRIPPLRERREDAEFFIEHFLEREASALERSVPRLEPEARAALLAYDWPGNVRELQHALRSSLSLLAGDRLRLDDLPPAVRDGYRARGAGAGSRERGANATYSIPTHLSYAEQVEAFERVLLERAWRAHGGDRRRICEALALAPHQLKYLVQRLQLRLEGAPPGGENFSPPARK
ncbi:MAG: sigma 54-interacting transcriptional regulator [Planctomycetes bacterium]|nr:sigma 54-interacting transcriptional regulator [Planctomycetota bacterium]